MKNAKTVAADLQKLIDRYALGSKLTAQIIQDWVYNDNGDSPSDASNRFLMKWTKFFDKQFEKESKEFNKILNTFTDAWNYFPHKSLGGRSPEEKCIELYGRAPGRVSRKSEGNPKPNAMSDIYVGGVKMTWEEYQAMLAEMGKAQRPFKRFIKAKYAITHPVLVGRTKLHYRK